MSLYHTIIREAVGDVSNAVCAEIEDTMRHTIFHSTLDWQTRAQLHKAAREAKEIVEIMADPVRLRAALALS